MDGRAFLDSRGSCSRRPASPTVLGRGARYIALLNEALAALERWGFPLPAGADVHAFVVARFASRAITNLVQFEVALNDLRDLTREADHALSAPGRLPTRASFRISTSWWWP